MDILNITAVVIGFLALVLSALAQVVQSSAKTAPYAELLKQVEKILSGKPISTRPLETQLEEAVKQLNEASARVGNILGDIQTDVDRKLREAERLKSAIEELRKEYEENKTLANLTTEEADAVR